MKFSTKKGIKYEVTTHKTKSGLDRSVYISNDNRGKFIRNIKTKATHHLKIAFEGLGFYHIGNIASSPCEMVLKSEFEVVIN